MQFEVEDDNYCPIMWPLFYGYKVFKHTLSLKLKKSLMPYSNWNSSLEFKAS